MKDFKMRSPPLKQVQGKRRFDASFEDGDTIPQIVNRLARAIERDCQLNLWPGYEQLTESWLLKNLAKLQIWIEKDPYDYGGNYSCEVKSTILLEVQESDEEFAKQVKGYEARLAIYNDWRKKHASEIAAYEAKIKAEKDARKRKEKAAAARKFKEEKERLQKLLEQTQKRLSKIKAQEQV